jgi:hypothetical protein
MTPKEAIETLRERAKDGWRGMYDRDVRMEVLERYAAASEQALATLAHYTMPHTEPPTVEEVGNKQQCLVRVSHTKNEWCNHCGEDVRTYWLVSFDAWLPVPEVTNA